ncbi:DoxX-like protein [Saccharothrix saharensis]|uniref:DoxX-like protein n=1 Tax=Saccharothrix saharensis TaxID=571190 RepID=A0A543JDA7_9PSEU|nr:DoxX family protein [Saccharothrix saharensis]TQM80829.1 DoxX-like protein [Saccharothrix saharensis]
MADAARPNVVRDVANIALWVLQVLLAAYFVHSGVSLLGDDFVGKFDRIGSGQWLRYVTGVLEIAGALGLLVPVLCGLAGLGLAGVMAGAVVTELFVLRDSSGAVLPAVLLVLAAVVAWGRRDTVRGLLQRFGK